MKVRLWKGPFGRWIIVGYNFPEFAWSGSRWVQQRDGIPTSGVQISNFETEEEAREYASSSGFQVMSDASE